MEAALCQHHQVARSCRGKKENAKLLKTDYLQLWCLGSAGFGAWFLRDAPISFITHVHVQLFKQVMCENTTNNNSQRSVWGLFSGGNKCLICVLETGNLQHKPESRL